MMFVFRLLLLVGWFVVVINFAAMTLVLRPQNLSMDRNFVRWMRRGTERFVPLKIDIEGREHLTAARPCVFICNHQHILDALLVADFYPPRTVVVGKIELKKVPVFGWAFEKAGNVFIDRTDRERSIASLKELGERIRRDDLNLWMFPEGTRNRAEKGIQPFKKGAFHTAIQLGVPIVPVVTSPSWHLLNIFRFNLRPGHVAVRILPPIPTTGLTSDDVNDLVADTHRRMVEVHDELEAKVDYS